MRTERERMERNRIVQRNERKKEATQKEKGSENTR